MEPVLVDPHDGDSQANLRVTAVRRRSPYIVLIWIHVYPRDPVVPSCVLVFEVTVHVVDVHNGVSKPNLDLRFAAVLS